MKIGITTSSDINLYASTLISKLISQSDTPVCIVCIQKPAVARAISRIRRRGPVRGTREIFQRAGSASIDGNIDGRVLRDYAVANNLLDWDAPLIVMAMKYGIGYLKVYSVNSRHAIDHIRKNGIDVLVNAGGGIFRSAFVNAPCIGILNAHMGRLPSFRGMNVLEWSLFNNEKIGVTLHFIDTGIDTGDILLFREIPIEIGDTIASLRARSLPISVELAAEGINMLKRGELVGVKQNAEDGKQYFVMHRRLKSIVEEELKHQRKLEVVPN